MKQVAIGIDIGGTNTVLGLVDQNGNVLAKDYFSTAKYNNITEYTNKLSGNINKLLERLSQIEVNLHIRTPFSFFPEGVRIRKYFR